MKQSLSDDDLRHTHSAFHADHEQLRQQLLTALETCRPKPVSSSRALPRSTWIAMSLPICLMIAILVWVALDRATSHQVYALDEIGEKFLHIRSVYIRGAYYSTVGENETAVEKAFPIEMYAERPSGDQPARFYQVWHGIEDDGKQVRVREGSFAADGTRTLALDRSEELATRGKTGALSTELQVEQALQNQWLKQIVHGPTSNYRLVGPENVNEQKALKYESVEKSDEGRVRYLIWLSVVTGLPIRTSINKFDATGKEVHDRVYETIQINSPPPDTLFTFDPPDGYRAIDQEEMPEDFVISSGGGHNDRTALRYAFAIDRLGVLICWYCGSVGPQPVDLQQVPVIPEVELRDHLNQRKCELRSVRSQLEGDRLWQWSLVTPLDRKPLNPDETLIIALKTNHLHSTFEGSPLRLDDERLKRILTQMKELGTPVGESQPEMTLVRLRWLAAHEMTR